MIRLNEMSMELKTIKNNLYGKTKPILNHLFKIIVYKDLRPQDVNHWKTEIYNFLHDIPKIKSNNKYPSSKKIFDMTFNSWSDTLSDSIPAWRRDLKSEGYPDIDCISYKEIYDKSKLYFEWLSKKLSSKGEISKTEVFNFLDEIL